MSAPDPGREWPKDQPLPEGDHLGLARKARDLDDYRLDELIAVFTARRNVAQAHGLPGVAGTWHDALVVLAEVRSARVRTRREFEAMPLPTPHDGAWGER